LIPLITSLLRFVFTTAATTAAWWCGDILIDKHPPTKDGITVEDVPLFVLLSF
jgi:hypothetical protein